MRKILFFVIFFALLFSVFVVLPMFDGAHYCVPHLGCFDSD